MDPRIATMTDAALRKTQRHTEALCAFLDAVTRTVDGERTRALAELNNRARMLLREVEKEYFARHPEAENAREQQQLRLCEAMIDGRNRDDFARDPDAVMQQSFVEYNTPMNGRKTVTCHKVRRTSDRGDQHERSQQEFPMNIADELFATLEDAMDAYAKDM